MHSSTSLILYEEDTSKAAFYSKLIHQTISCSLTLAVRVPELAKLLEGSDRQVIVISHVDQCVEILKTVKKMAPFAVFMLISGTPSIEQAVSAIKLGAEEYFALPLKEDLFQLALKRVVEHSLARESSIEYVDDVTGLYNSRYLNAILKKEIQSSQVNHRTFAILFIDADQFKSVNDAYGHVIGTKLLHELSTCLKKHVRERDTLFRYGGDEFVAVLGSCDLITAKIVGERIRHAVAKEIFLRSEDLNIHVTISVGIALFPDHATTQNELIEVADRNMYKAKNAKKGGMFGGGSKVNSSSL